jgi:pyridoxamine 5'-phosphate oxidase
MQNVSLYKITFMEDLSNYIRNLRSDFSQMSLSESDVNPDPAIQFQNWFKQAVDSEVNEPNAFVLSTVNSEGRPSGRVVLLREFYNNNFGLFTNYNSRKGKELEKNPYAAFTFFWPELERQIRIEGKVEKNTMEASDKYFNSRPRTSRIGAWSSPQSSVLKNREELEKLVTDFDIRYPTEEVPRPVFWGGYLLKADYYEFWQGRQSRLHDRICYNIQLNKTWKIERLAP